MTAVDLPAIRAQHAAITKLGKWETRGNDVVIYDPNGYGAYCLIATTDTPEDAAFIAAAPSTVARLLGIVEAVLDLCDHQGGRMSKTMAEVLADHHSKHYDGELGAVFCLDPTCNWNTQAHNFAIAAEEFAAHQAAALSAAGFGPVQEALDALGEARAELVRRRQDFETVADTMPNPTDPYGMNQREWIRTKANPYRQDT